MAFLFSYGTLQKEQVQQKLFGRVLQGATDVLNGYRVAAIEIRDEKFLLGGGQKEQRIAMASTNEKDQVDDMVFEVTVEDLLLADSYEPGDYQRLQVVLASG